MYILAFYPATNLSIVKGYQCTEFQKQITVLTSKFQVLGLCDSISRDDFL